MARDPSQTPRPARPAHPVSRPASPGPALLDRAAAVVGAIARSILRLGGAALLAGIAIWLAVYQEAEDAGAIGLALVAIVVLVPPVLLFLFATALRALAAFPRRLWETPGAVGGRVVDVRRRLTEVGEARRRGFVASIRTLFRLGWSVASSREVLEVSPALVFLTPGLMMASLVAAGAALLEILAGAIAVLVLLL